MANNNNRSFTHQGTGEEGGLYGAQNAFQRRMKEYGDNPIFQPEKYNRGGGSSSRRNYRANR